MPRTPATIWAVSTSMARSSTGANGCEVGAVWMRPAGASSSSKASSFIAWAISAPMPHIAQASSTTSRRWVLHTLSTMASMSSGMMVLRSMTSHCTPSAASSSAASSDFCTCWPAETMVMSVPARAMRATPNGT